MHGAGNSFVITESLHDELKSGDLSVLALRLCDPETGPGADGLMVLVPADKGADFRMLFYNSDGSSGMALSTIWLPIPEESAFRQPPGLLPAGESRKSSMRSV